MTFAMTAFSESFEEETASPVICPEIDPKQRRLTYAWNKARDELCWSSTVLLLMTFMENLLSPASSMLCELDSMFSVEYLIYQDDDFRGALMFPFVSAWLLFVSSMTLVAMTISHVVAHPLDTITWATTQLLHNTKPAIISLFDAVKADLKRAHEEGVMTWCWRSVCGMLCLVRLIMAIVVVQPLVPFSIRSIKILASIPVEMVMRESGAGSDMQPHLSLWRFVARPWSSEAWHNRWQRSKVWRNDEMWKEPISNDSAVACSRLNAGPLQ